MLLTFDCKKLNLCANEDKEGKKELGIVQFKKFKKRIDALHAAQNLEILRNVPGKFHELKEDRKGQWACSLDGGYRLIFEPLEDPIPINEDGQYIWSEIKGVRILQIINYHSK